MYMYHYGIEYILIGISILITLGAQFFINAKYKKTKQLPVKKYITGHEVARKILDKHKLKDIEVVETGGNLSDHYDSSKKIVRLSSDIYNKATIASVSVAAHECGHAIQDKNNYVFLRLRNTIIPLVNISSKLGYIAILIGLFSRATGFLKIGIIFELVILLFQVITLPVEFNASKRGLKELKELKIVEESEFKLSRGMLIAAALTYVASVASSLLEIFRLLTILNRKR